MNDLVGGNDVGSKKRGGGFTAVLVLFTLATAAASVMNLAMADSIVRNLPGAPEWAGTGILAMGGLGILATVGLIGVWMWKKWGVYLYLGLGALVFFLNLALGLGLPRSLVGLIGIAFISMLVKKNWESFE